MIGLIGQYIYALVFNLNKHNSSDEFVLIAALGFYLWLVAIFWQILKKRHSLLICGISLGTGLVIHTILFFVLWNAALPITPTEDDSRQAAFREAIQKPDVSTVQAMIADSNFHPRLRARKCTHDMLCNLISNAVASNDEPSILETLRKAGSPIDEPDGDTGETPIMRALLAGHLNDAYYLAKAGANPLSTFHLSYEENDDDSGSSVLIIAAAKGSPEIMEALITNGAPVNNCDFGTNTVSTDEMFYPGDGVTPLMEAALAGRLDLIRILLAHGADPRIRNESNHTLFDYIKAGRRPSIEPAVTALN